MSRDDNRNAMADCVVLSKQQACAITNLSADTLDRLHRKHAGPPRVQLSPRRVEYPAGALRAWLKERSKTNCRLTQNNSAGALDQASRHSVIGRNFGLFIKKKE